MWMGRRRHSLHCTTLYSSFYPSQDVLRFLIDELSYSLFPTTFAYVFCSIRVTHFNIRHAGKGWEPTMPWPNNKMYVECLYTRLQSCCSKSTKTDRTKKASVQQTGNIGVILIKFLTAPAPGPWFHGQFSVYKTLVCNNDVISSSARLHVIMIKFLTAPIPDSRFHGQFSVYKLSEWPWLVIMTSFPPPLACMPACLWS